MTGEAERFVGPETFSALSRRPVLRDAPALDGSYPHLDASRIAPLVCIAPCTANTLAKLAHGLADNVVTQSALAAAGPLRRRPGDERAHVGAPGDARERRRRSPSAASSWSAPRRARSPRASGGWAACPSPPRSPRRSRRCCGRRGPLTGRRVLVTSGGTREPLDPVRFLGNRSSGRMGAALADEAARRGADVVAARRERAGAPERSGEVVEVETTAELEREALAQARHGRRRADGRRGRRLSARSARSTGKRDREGSWALELEATERHPRGHRRRAPAGPGARRLRGRDRRRRRRARARQARRARASTWSC